MIEDTEYREHINAVNDSFKVRKDERESSLIEE